MRTLLVLVLALVLGGSADAQTIRLDRVRSLLHDAQTALTRASASPKTEQLAALGKAVRAHEAALAALRSVLRSMAEEEDVLAAGLDQERAKLTEMLGVLQSIGRAPQSALLAFPGGPIKAARAASVMAELTPKLAARTAKIEDRLDEVRALRTRQDEARTDARGALARLQDLRARTAQLLRNRSKQIPAEELAEQAAVAGRQAQSIGQLSAVLARAATKNLERVDFDGLRGILPLPVEGRIASRYGSTGRIGYGITLAAPAFAQVSAPVDGVIRYAGPLKGYGTVAVLEPEDGWMIVMAGLGDVVREVGEAVSVGEKIGDLGGPLPTSEEFLLEAGDQSGEMAEETLYIEFRRGDQPVDPAPWFRTGG